MTAAQITGLYLIVEGLASIFYSIDQRGASQIGRIGRVVIGIYMLEQKQVI